MTDCTLLVDSDLQRVRDHLESEHPDAHIVTVEERGVCLDDVDGTILKWSRASHAGRLRELADEAEGADTPLVVYVPATMELHVLGENPCPVVQSQKQAVNTLLNQMVDP